MPPQGDSPKQLSNFLVMRILKNIQRKVSKFERAEEAGDIEEMLLNQLSEEEQQFLRSQVNAEEGTAEESAGAVLEGLSTDKLLKMYEEFRKN